MMRYLRLAFSSLRYFDWILFFSVMLLISFSLSALYGIASGSEEANFTNFTKHLIFSLIGISLVFIMSFMDLSILSSFAYLLYVAVLFLLISVLFFGVQLRGTSGWLQIIGLNFQPVEVAKVALIILLAKLFSDVPPADRNALFLIKTGFFVAVYFILVMLQPDFGSGFILLLIWLGLLGMSGVKLRYLFSLIFLFFLLFFIAWFGYFQEYQKERILTFFHPTADPLGSGYHVRQSIIAIGSGEIFGRGLASGSQSQLKFVPASQTDFIYAVIGEEYGLLGSSIVLILFAIFLYRIFRLTKVSQNDFAFYLVLGIFILFFSQIVINIGMNLGMMPVTGIGLPFLSYGGSFLLMSFICIGIAQNIAMQQMKYRI